MQEITSPDLKIDIGGVAKLDLEAINKALNTPGSPLDMGLRRPKANRSRLLRDVIPAGKGRFSKGEAGTQEYLDRIRRGQRAGFKSFAQICNSESGVVCIVGGGPTLQDEVGALRRLIKRGAKTIAVNKSHDWLVKRGLPCHYAALLDPKEWVKDYITLNYSKDTKRKAGKLWADPKYLIASQCHDAVLDKFKPERNAYLWHAGAGLGEAELLKQEFAGEEHAYVPGASVIGIRAGWLAYALGFREIHFFGIDGSAKLPDPRSLKQIFGHFVKVGLYTWKEPRDPTTDEMVFVLMALAKARAKMPQEVNDIIAKHLYSYGKPVIDPTWSGYTAKLSSGWQRHYLSNHHMARSVYEFEDQVKEWERLMKTGKIQPFQVFVHGNPEHSAIGIVAAGMGIHADPEINEMYGKPPKERSNA